jgi:hypothetical protein
MKAIFANTRWRLLIGLLCGKPYSVLFAWYRI